MAADGNGNNALNRWHALLAMIALVGTMAISYATTKVETEENTRQIRQIQEDTVKKEQLEDIKARLDRIEKKLDRVEEERLARH